MTQRESNFELLRIVAMLMIIGCHFATHGGFNFETQKITVPQLWWYVLEMGGNFGVVVFVMISGYFLIDSTRLNIDYTRVLRLWGEVFFYSFMLFCVALFIGRGNLSRTSIASSLFPISSGQWWFASTYFVLYIIHPYINRLLRSLTKEEFRRLLLLMFVLWSIIPSLFRTNFQSNELIEFVFYYSVAGYIRLYGLNTKCSRKIWFLLWALFSVLTYMTCVVCLLVQIKIPGFPVNPLHFYYRNSPLTICRAICFFMLFKNLNIKSNMIINAISASTFGVYLLHDSNLLRPLLWHDIFHNADYQHTTYFIPYSLFVVLVVFVVCSTVDLIRKWILEKPLIEVINSCKDKLCSQSSKKERNND